MVARLLRLRVRALLGAFRGGRADAARAVVASAALVVVSVLAVAGLLALGRGGDREVAADVIVTGGALVLAALLLVPVLFVRPDLLDPRAFRLFDLPHLPLAGGLALASILSAPVLAVAVAAAVTVGLWPSFVAALSLVLQIATAALFLRIATAVAGFTRSSARVREGLAVLGVVGLLVLVAVAVTVSDAGWRAGAALASTADALRWSPLGAVWAAPAAAQEEGGAAVGLLLVATATLVVAAAVWVALVHRVLSVPERTHRPPRALRLGWFDVLPGGAAGAVAARSITYWLRDPRYQLALVAVPLVPLVASVLLASVGVPFGLLALLPVPLALLLLGWSLHNDLAHDGSAFWLHIASGVSGWADRVGRLVPTLLVGVPLVVLGSYVSSLGTTLPGALPVLLAVNTCILLSTAGVSSVVSALMPYPAPRPGESAFVHPQAPGAGGATAQSLAFGLGLGFSAPAIVLGLRALLAEPSVAGDALAWGYGAGAVVLVLGVVVGGVVLDRRSTALVAFTSRY